MAASEIIKVTEKRNAWRYLYWYRSCPRKEFLKFFAKFTGKHLQSQEKYNESISQFRIGFIKSMVGFTTRKVWLDFLYNKFCTWAFVHFVSRVAKRFKTSISGKSQRWLEAEASFSQSSRNKNLVIAAKHYGETDVKFCNPFHFCLIFYFVPLIFSDLRLLSDCNGTRTHNHLVRKRTLNYLVKLAWKH